MPSLLPSLFKEIRAEQPQMSKKHTPVHPQLHRVTLTDNDWFKAFVSTDKLFALNIIQLFEFTVLKVDEFAGTSVLEMYFSGKNLRDGESGSLKKSKKKQKGEVAWKPEGPKDPFAMVCVFVWVWKIFRLGVLAFFLCLFVYLFVFGVCVCVCVCTLHIKQVCLQIETNIYSLYFCAQADSCCCGIVKEPVSWENHGKLFFPFPVLCQLDSLPEKKQQEIQKALHLFCMGPNLPKNLQQAKKHTYHFWDTQPVPKLGKKKVLPLQLC